MIATCQTNAVNTAVMSSSVCQAYYTASQESCCPDQIQAIQTCSQAMGCVDQACLRAMCGTQLRAADPCLQSAQMNSATCQAAYQVCLGQSFPQLICD